MRLLKRAKSQVQQSVGQTREPRRTCMRNIYIYIYIPYRHVANDEAQYYIHLRLYCRLYVYNYVYPIQIYQIYCTMLAVSAESVTEQRARSRDLRHEASTVVVTATMGSAVAKLAVEQDFERCSELRRWRLEHEGAKPNRRSDDPNKKSLANWLSMVLPRRFRASGTKSSQRKLTVEESAHLEELLGQDSGAGGSERRNAADLKVVQEAGDRDKM